MPNIDQDVIAVMAAKALQTARTGSSLAKKAMDRAMTIGPQGEPGPQGPAGPAGRDGLPGKDGHHGKDGVDGKDGAQGRAGPMPRHEIDGTRVRFEVAPRTWGDWIELIGPRGPRGPSGPTGPAIGIAGAGINPDNTITLTLTDGSTITTPEALHIPFDDYAQAEYLPDQASTGSELTFSFTAPVQFVAVEMVSLLTDQDAQDAQEGRVTTGTTAPAQGIGAILKHEQPVTLLVDTTAVRVLAPASCRVTVYGKRRVAV